MLLPGRQNAKFSKAMHIRFLYFAGKYVLFTVYINFKFNEIVVYCQGVFVV
ncbi:hypothetical protein JCM12294_22060 [Desulfocicer niacini]